MTTGRMRIHPGMTELIAFLSFLFIGGNTGCAQVGNTAERKPKVPAILPEAVESGQPSTPAAQGETNPDPSPFVVDKAKIVESSHRWGIERMLRDLYERSGITVKLLTVATTDGEGFIPFVERHARSWGLAGARNDSGALIVIMPRGPGQRGRVRIHAAYRLQEVLSESWCRAACQEVVGESFRHGRLSNGSTGITTKVAERLAEAAHVSLKTVAEYARSHESPVQPKPGATGLNGSNDEGHISSTQLPAQWKPWEANVVRVFGALNLRLAGGVSDVALSPDSRFVLSAGDGLLLSDARTGAGVRTFGDENSVLVARFSADGSLVMAVTRDKPPMFLSWDATTGVERQRQPLPNLGALADVAVMSDGRYAVMGFRTDTGKNAGMLVKLTPLGLYPPLRVDATEPGLQVAFSHDGSRYAGVAGSAEVRTTVSGDSLLRLADATGPIALSPDGSRLAINNGPVQVWDVDNQRRILSLPCGDAKVLDVAFSADGRRIITGGWDANVRVWDANTGEPLAVLMGHTKGVSHVALDAQGKRAVSSSTDGMVKFWNVETHTEDPEFPGHATPVRSLGYCAPIRALLSAERSAPLHVWSVDTGQLIDFLENEVGVEGHAVIAPTGDAVARVYGDPGGRLGFDFIVSVSAVGHRALPTFPGALPIAFNAGATHIAYRRGLDTIVVAGVALQKTVATIDDLYELHRAHLALSPDATKLACGDIFGKITIWSLPSTETLHHFEAHDKDVTALAFSLDGNRLVSASAAGELKLWDMDSGACLYSKSLPIFPHSLCFAPDGKRLFTGNDDGSIVLWDFGFPPYEERRPPE